MTLAQATAPVLEELCSEDVALDGLSINEHLRTGGLSETHISLLMQVASPWPPIVVWGDRGLIIDGSHRVEAARRLNRTSLRAVQFRGTFDEAYVESVRLNVRHGLPLTMDDRRRAAAWMVRRHSDWSNMRIAELCGVSSRAVARLREDVHTDERTSAEPIERRTGRDGRRRPVEHEKVRERIVMELRRNPTGSLREIGAVAGASPETVRAVKATKHDIGSTGQVKENCEAHDTEWRSAIGSARSRGMTVTSTEDFWLNDSALLATGEGTQFASWFDATKVDGDYLKYVPEVPLSRVYEIADEAHRRSAAWTEFAKALEARTRASQSDGVVTYARSR